jgi:hypothetical protein
MKGFVCNAGSGDDCDPDEVCSGVAREACPVDTVTTAGTVCRTGSGDQCDPDEKCTGTADAACPTDVVTPPGTVCNPGSGDMCDPEEKCSGVAKAACPADVFAPSTTVCRASGTGDAVCDPPEKCPGTPDATCPADARLADGAPCGDPKRNACTEPDTCKGGTCAKNDLSCAFVTNSELCSFDEKPAQGTCDLGGKACVVNDASDACVQSNGVCEQSKQFRLVFTPDTTNGLAFQMTSSNPGQYFYNFIETGAPNSVAEVTIDVPYPFVTAGAVPVHVYDSALTQHQNGCFLPPAETLATDSTLITLADYVAGTQNDHIKCDRICGPNGFGKCSLRLSVPIPGSGESYVNLHLDYGLKGPSTNANPCNDGLADRYDPANLNPVFGGWDALQDTSGNNGPLALRNGVSYNFSHTDGKVSFADFVQNFNDFQKVPGVLGRVFRSDTNLGVQGVQITLRNAATGVQVGSNLSNHDGNYVILFDHTGRPANYLVAAPSKGIELQVRLTAHQSTTVNFDLFTGKATEVP